MRQISTLFALISLVLALPAHATTQYIHAGYTMTVTATGANGTLSRLTDEPLAPLVTSSETVSVGTPVTKGPYGTTTRWDLTGTLTYVTAPATLALDAQTTILAGLTATAAEVNNTCDVSAKVQAISAAGAITADGTVGRVTLTGGAYAITLAAPAAAAIGTILEIEYIGGDTDADTMALTNVVGGTAGTSASFNADGEILILIAGKLKWVVIAEVGVTLS